LKYFYSIALLFLAACAQVVAPTGGAKDVTPPKAVDEKTVPLNFTTSFIASSIVIPFNEYFRLNNPNQNIIITPSLKEKPEYIIKGKKLIIKLNNKLDTNTTYSINFGEAISDVTENNITKNFKYVFSTGTYLDSLEIKGSVANAFTNTLADDVVVMLYKQYFDSIPMKEKPYYFAKTTKDGKFQISNIKEGTYKLFALKDANNNFLYDNPSEDIGFVDTLISISAEHNHTFALNLFNEGKQKFVSTAEFNTNNSIRLSFNKAVKSTPAFDESAISHIYFKPNSDSCLLFLKDTVKTKTEIPFSIVEHDYKDTLRVRTKSINQAFNASAKQKNNLINTPVSFITNYPLNLINAEFVSIIKDSVSFPFIIKKNDNDQRNLDVEVDTKEAGEYTLKILPKALTNYLGVSNKDTLQALFSLVKGDFYSTLELTIIKDSLAQKGNYILQLLDDKSTVLNSFSISELPYKLRLTDLLPRSYSLRLIADENNNGQWDTGNYLENKQPEKIITYPKSITLRSNWEMNETWELKLAD
jgi:uncharacterized protein (DUF2141 family)